MQALDHDWPLGLTPLSVFMADFIRGGLPVPSPVSLYPPASKLGTHLPTSEGWKAEWALSQLLGIELPASWAEASNSMLAALPLCATRGPHLSAYKRILPTLPLLSHIHVNLSKHSTSHFNSYHIWESDPVIQQNLLLYTFLSHLSPIMELTVVNAGSPHSFLSKHRADLLNFLCWPTMPWVFMHAAVLHLPLDINASKEDVTVH